ncbi:hypothetical protein M427DRAFT_235695 [Gonapodya prolifera JEL478]|uniref:Uncharacterized protein n=1 Tax=Gonapodya prolifera (strain JEL478) TaxID=1344416 RepID=A0A139AMF8_GONPJ|nr:hypothetical protein M427DRAFT_235695 [Gonapodya prolifera JEL478]|eukprot:KXS17939.1 hypothetical protein M427DRAFT_235695 [Gonapodya prolifera JEL478]
MDTITTSLHERDTPATANHREVYIDDTIDRHRGVMGLRTSPMLPNPPVAQPVPPTTFHSNSLAAESPNLWGRPSLPSLGQSSHVEQSSFPPLEQSRHVLNSSHSHTVTPRRMKPKLFTAWQDDSPSPPREQYDSDQSTEKSPSKGEAGPQCDRGSATITEPEMHGTSPNKPSLEEFNGPSDAKSHQPSTKRSLSRIARFFAPKDIVSNRESVGQPPKTISTGSSTDTSMKRPPDQLSASVNEQSPLKRQRLSVIRPDDLSNSQTSSSGTQAVAKGSKSVGSFSFRKPMF